MLALYSTYWRRILATVIIETVFTHPDLPMKQLFATVLAGLYIAGLSLPAHAYLDPNIGSMLLQGILAGLAAAGLVIKTYWYRIKGFFSKQPGEPEEAAPEADKPTDDPPQ
jgi:hypothetical protein